MSRYWARAVGVGWSKISVGGRVWPVCSAKALRSSRAVRESMPRSLKGRSGSRLVGSRWANTVAVVLATRAISAWRCWSGVWVASRVVRVCGLADEAAWGREVVRADRTVGRVLRRARRVRVRRLSGAASRVGWCWVSAASNTAKPWSLVIGVKLVRVMWAWSIWLRWVVIPDGVSQGPQATVVAPGRW
ncbi:hypothetical protein MSIMFI_05473 [Mycobacterium simulans]|nr:hypothetical protein MSIMFI_05473 [Mycobacterium simulans]